MGGWAGAYTCLAAQWAIWAARTPTEAPRAKWAVPSLAEIRGRPREMGALETTAQERLWKL